MTPFYLIVFLEVNRLDFFERKKARSSEEVVNTAKKMIGTGGYHLLYNNCEHFVYQCKFGEKKSSQVDEVREKMSKISSANVYIAKIPNKEEFNPINTPARIEEINGITNISVKNEKTFIWNVLEYALHDSMGLDLNSVNISKNENGKLKCHGCEISLSHCKEFVAVAVGKIPIGIDLEYGLKYDPNIVRKVFTQDENNQMVSTKNQDLLFTSIWTKKESIFKRLDKKEFIPREIETKNENTKSYCLSIEKDCVISVSSLFLETVEIVQLNYHNHIFKKISLKYKEI